MSGFTYNGVHSESMAVGYAPDASARWFDDADFDVYSTRVAWRHGGYRYGAKAKIRTFTLQCWFEEITIAQREAIRRWLHRDTKGQLIFDDKPFVYWNVSPSKIVPGQLYLDLGKYSGTFTVTFEAYDPFGYLTRKSNAGTENDGAEDYCWISPTSQMPPAPTTSSRSFTVYNPGTEDCGLTLKLAGSASNPIEFLNTTNKTRCIIRAFPTNGLILDINGDTGKVKTYVSTSPNMYDNGYAYHDRGHIRLDPGSNAISIMEQNASGNWVTPTTLSLSSIAIDYSPRIL